MFSWSQVLIYLRWLQYIVHMVVYDRPHVFINVDETALASVRHSGRGMACLFRRSRASPKTRPRDRTDRSFTNTTLIAAACDCPGLQPLLPQVILARYSQNASVPATLLAHYRSCGFPFEFWHGSMGRVTPVTPSWRTSPQPPSSPWKCRRLQSLAPWPHRSEAAGPRRAAAPRLTSTTRSTRPTAWLRSRRR